MVQPLTIEHPNRDKLTAFLCGHLAAAEQDAIAAHIAECDECCQALREIPDDAFLALLKDANSAPDTGDPKHYGSVHRDLSLPIELRKHPRYKIGKCLGSGGMGVVYQAEHRLMDRIVALKIIHRDLIRHPRVLQRFRQEVKAAARLAHPNIVTAYDADQAGDAHFLVMEFVDGVSLDRLVAKSGPLEPTYACYFVRQAAKGLEHAFHRGMVHRDIKPQNLMLTRKGQVKILDFGLARLASEAREDYLPTAPTEARAAGPADLTHFGDVMGTPDYMAPEQAIDPRKADIRADIYSLGCTLYALLTGKTPFGVGSPQSKVLAKKDAKPQPITELRRGLPRGLIATIATMMAHDASDRYPTPADVARALAPFAKPKPLTKPAATATPTVPPPASAPTPMKKTPTPPSVEIPPVVDTAGPDVRTFLARCPFCLTRLRISAKALGASLPCPHCGSFFTVVPEDERTTAR